MILLTEKIKEQLPAIHSTCNTKLSKKTFICKFFNPTGTRTWYVVEGQEDTYKNLTDWDFWGMVEDGPNKEWKYFSLSQLEGAELIGYPRIERDPNFENEPSADYM